MVNETYLNGEQSISLFDGQTIKVESYERKLAEGKTFSVVLGVPGARLDRKMFEHPVVHEVFSLSVGLLSSSVYLISPETYESHINELEWLYDRLEDDYSRDLLFTNLLGRLTGKDIDFMPSPWSDPQYFLPDLVHWNRSECIMDGGAYIGDTVEEFLQKKGTVADYKVYAWEPDNENFSALKKNYAGDPHVIPVNKGMYSCKGTMCFSSGSGEGSHITDEGNIEIAVDTIDNVAGTDKVTFIKMDIEGCELEALKGAAHQIKSNKPRLAICLYHKQEDIWTIPQYIYSINPSYKFYLRTHAIMPTELVLFCLPE